MWRSTVGKAEQMRGTGDVEVESVALVSVDTGERVLLGAGAVTA